MKFTLFTQIISSIVSYLTKYLTISNLSSLSNPSKIAISSLYSKSIVTDDISNDNNNKYIKKSIIYYMINLNITKILMLVMMSVMLSNMQSALASGDSQHTKIVEKKWYFDGILGKFDKRKIQRGFQVYQEVCSSCHSMNLLYYRNLEEVGFSKNEVKAIAASRKITDGPNDSGDYFDRPAKPSDRFKNPFPNEQAARASNGGAYPVDLSLIIKARPNGANYVYSLLTGYKEPPHDFHLQEGMSYNTAFFGNQIAMPSPLSNDVVEYTDKTKATVEQMSEDIVYFLQWAAEPEMEKRKQMGLKVILFLLIFTFVFYLSKCRIWKKVK